MTSPSSPHAIEAIDTRLQRVIDAHGGMDAWHRLESITLRLRHLGGPLPLAKGLGRTFIAPERITIAPSRRRVVFHDFPAPGDETVFDNGRMQVHTDAPTPALDTPDYRRRFRGLVKYRLWSPTDAAYFFGYALATYLSVPFVLPAYATDLCEVGDRLRVRARFPADIETHSAVQTFWFNRDGLLARHDYRADIVGWWATGAHLTSDYDVLDGWPIATRRRVFARVLDVVLPVPVLSADVEPVEVRHALTGSAVSL
jgi:hypothetical protein